LADIENKGQKIKRSDKERQWWSFDNGTASNKKLFMSCSIN